jgi:hypothetical protein
MQVGKRGQAALEFLMTYGWAILVVLVAIGALAYFGVLRPERLLPEKCVIATGSGLYCDDYSARSPIVFLRIKNMLAVRVNITSVNISRSGTSDTCTAWTGSVTIAPDNTADFDINCGGLSAGDKVKGEILIEFIKSDGLVKTTSGELVTTAA